MTRLYGWLYAVSAVALLVGLALGTVLGNGPDHPAMWLILGVATLALGGLSAFFLSPERWWRPLGWLVAATCVGFWLALSLTALVAPDVVSDPLARRGPRTESGARWLGGALLVTPVLSLAVVSLVAAHRDARWRGRAGRAPKS
ncbi:hypothetical protein [Nocardioides sp. W7]|uniref:hypothetical protein n=1 Tax=Nocardioides sp. W7 TaxID=2931390 RepID=UPI001FD10863|nr:hypothetical protein [Nocardioides sp. W7]